MKGDEEEAKRVKAWSREGIQEQVAYGGIKTAEGFLPVEEPTRLSRFAKEGKKKRKKYPGKQTPVVYRTGRFCHTRSLNHPSDPRALDARGRGRNPLGATASQHPILARPRTRNNGITYP